MNNKIAITFGTKNILTSIQNKYPKQQLILTQSCINRQNFQLIHFYNRRSLFNNPIIYNIKEENIQNNEWTYINYDYKLLDNNEQKIFDSEFYNYINKYLSKNIFSIYSLILNNNSSQRVVITTWKDINKYQQWYKKFYPFKYKKGYKITYKKIRD